MGRPPDARRHRLAQPVQRQLRLLLPVDLHARVLAGRHRGPKSDAQAALHRHLHRGLLPGVEPGEVGARDVRVLRLEQQGAARRPHALSSPHPFPSQVRVLRRAAVHHGLPLPDVPHEARDEDVQAALQRLLEHLGHDALLGTRPGRVPDIQGAAHTHTSPPPHRALTPRASSLPLHSSPRSR